MARNKSGLIPGGKRYRILPGLEGAVVLDQVNRSVSDAYTMRDAEALCSWLNDRVRGYRSLRRFEGGANWPVWST